MKTIFKIGMKVYDQIVFPDQEGKITNIHTYNDSPVEVSVESLNKKFFYKYDGTFLENLTPTLSTKPYKLEGFSQKPTFAEALKWLRDKYLGECVTYKIDGEKYFTDYYYSKNAPYKSFEALRKLIILRDYYNEGWQPDWKDDSYKEILCFETDFHSKKDFKYRFYASKNQPRVLAFKNSEIRAKFYKEQGELLEIAKPLL